MSQLNHGEVTAGCEHLQYDHGSVMARAQLNHGPGHGSVMAVCDHFGHRELTVSSHFFLMGKKGDKTHLLGRELRKEVQNVLAWA